MATTLTSKGQVTIPERIRDEMQLLRAQARPHALVINPIVHAEMSLWFSTIEALDDVART